MSNNAGVIDNLFPETLSVHKVMVPQVDRIGNDAPGVRHPLVEVPVATLTGWNTRTPEFGGNDLCDLLGSTIALRRTAQETRDARSAPALQALYRDRNDYLAKIEQAARGLQQQRFVLDEDVDLVVRDATADAPNW